MTGRYADLDRRITEVANRLSWMDEHGFRGAGVIQAQISELSTTTSKLERNVESLRRSVGIRQTFAFLAGLLPVYALLFLVIFGKGTS